MRFFYPILFIVFFVFENILTPFFYQIYGISITRGKEFRNYWPQVFESEADKAKY